MRPLGSEIIDGMGLFPEGKDIDNLVGIRSADVREDLYDLFGAMDPARLLNMLTH